MLGFVADVADGFNRAVGGVVFEAGFNAVVVGGFRDAAVFVEQTGAGTPAVADARGGDVNAPEFVREAVSVVKVMDLTKAALTATPPTPAKQPTERL